MVTVQKIIKQYKRFEDAQKLMSEYRGQGDQQVQGLSTEESQTSVEWTQAEELQARKMVLSAADIIINPFAYSLDAQERNGVHAVDQASLTGIPDEKK